MPISIPNSLRCILYVSSATQKNMSDDELEHLYRVAHRRNQECGITGVLLYSNGNFIQYIEGPSENLHKVYISIKRDKRHTGLIEIMNEPINDREFPDWSLASRKEFFQTFSNPKQYAELLIDDESARPTKRSAVCDMLHSFWNQTR
jgi:hypothetical protein